MLSISTITEALSFLTTETGRPWTESELFDAASTLHVELHASVPESMETVVMGLEPGKGLVEKHRFGRGHSLLAILFPVHVARLLIAGETTTVHPHDYNKNADTYKFLSEPLRVTRAEVRVRAESLSAILKGWRDIQHGDRNPPNTPAWMKPKNSSLVDEIQDSPTPQIATETLVPVARLAAQEARILQAIDNAGYPRLKLPVAKGKAGVKAEIWAAVEGERQIFSGKSTFDAAWKRLKGEAKIKDES